MRRIHCSYHKCLTVFFSRVMHGVFPFGGYGHFESRIGDFQQDQENYQLSSLNNHVLDLSLLGPGDRVSRFIRDPRDLVVSGFFYHKRGAEAWCTIQDPKDKNLHAVNGCVPRALKKGESIAECYERLGMEEGLMAEIDFRANHFASMLAWPDHDSRIATYRYEELIGQECEVMARLADHLELGFARKILTIGLAFKYSAKKQAGRTPHIRNPSQNQWRDYFSDRVDEYFMEKHHKILEKYDYQ